MVSVPLLPPHPGSGHPALAEPGPGMGAGLWSRVGPQGRHDFPAFPLPSWGPIMGCGGRLPSCYTSGHRARPSLPPSGWTGLGRRSPARVEVRTLVLTAPSCQDPYWSLFLRWGFREADHPPEPSSELLPCADPVLPPKAHQHPVILSQRRLRRWPWAVNFWDTTCSPSFPPSARVCPRRTCCPGPGAKSGKGPTN